MNYSIADHGHAHEAFERETCECEEKHGPDGGPCRNQPEAELELTPQGAFRGRRIWVCRQCHCCSDEGWKVIAFAEEYDSKGEVQMIAGNLTKADEKALLVAMIQRCPDGYLKDILMDCRVDVERAIDSDFGYIPFADRYRESEEHRKELEAQRGEIQALRSEIAQLERTKTGLENGLNELRATVRQFARI